MPLFAKNEPSDNYRLCSATFCVSVSRNDTQKVSRAFVERLTNALCYATKWLKSSTRSSQNPISGKSNPFGSCIESLSLWREPSEENTVWRDRRDDFVGYCCPTAATAPGDRTGDFYLALRFCAYLQGIHLVGAVGLEPTLLLRTRILSPGCPVQVRPIAFRYVA